MIPVVSEILSFHERLPLPTPIIDILAMIAITLLMVVLIYPNSERLLRVVALTVALIVLTLVIQNHSVVLEW